MLGRSTGGASAPYFECPTPVARLATETREADEMLEALTETPLGLLDLFGVAGAGLYICNYTLLVTRRTNADRPIYFVVNLAAAICLLISLSQAFNLGAALIQLFFCTMSVVGIVSRLHPLRRLRRPLIAAPQPIRWSQPGLDRERL